MKKKAFRNDSFFLNLIDLYSILFILLLQYLIHISLLQLFKLHNITYFNKPVDTYLRPLNRYLLAAII